MLGLSQHDSTLEMTWWWRGTEDTETMFKQPRNPGYPTTIHHEQLSTTFVTGVILMDKERKCSICKSSHQRYSSNQQILHLSKIRPDQHLFLFVEITGTSYFDSVIFYLTQLIFNRHDSNWMCQSRQFFIWDVKTVAGNWTAKSGPRAGK